MTTTADGLLQAILDEPDDDGLRLIYADYLEDVGDLPRAAFIRLQIDLARDKPVGDVNRAAVRAQELLDAHGDQWAAGVSEYVRDWTFKRGFIESVSVAARHFVESADALFRSAPLREVTLFWGMEQPYQRARFVPALAECSHLSRLRSLVLRHGFLGSSGMQALAVSEHLTGLEFLDLGYNHIGDGGVRALTACSWFENVRDLDLTYNDIGPNGARMLTARLGPLVEQGRGPTHIRLAGNRSLGVAGRRVIATSPLAAVAVW